MLTDEVNFPAPKFSWLFAEPHPLRLPAAIATLDAAALLKKVLRLNLRFIQSSSHIATGDARGAKPRRLFAHFADRLLHQLLREAKSGLRLLIVSSLLKAL